MKTYLDMDEILRHSRTYIGKGYYDDSYLDLVSAVPEEAIRSLPPADVAEVRHGQWIFQPYDYMPWCTKAICSSCKQMIANNADLSQDWGKRLFLKDNLFCAKCGAKMERGKNE